MDKELSANLHRLHTTPLGVLRVKNNLCLDGDDIISWCRDKIQAPGAVITRKGKNWYVDTDGCVITVNAGSYTVITAHNKR